MKQLAPLVVAAVLTVCGLPARAQEHDSPLSTIASTPQWETIKSLVGEWEGYYIKKSGQKAPVRITVRLTADGSAVMHWIDPGTPRQVITMFYMDREELLATHFCAWHNQPRFRAVPSHAADRIVFEFKDGTNIRPGDRYMRGLAVTAVDANHHDEEWSYDVGGATHAGTFHLTRANPTAAGAGRP